MKNDFLDRNKKLTDEEWQALGFVWSQRRSTWTRGNFKVILWDENFVQVNAFHSDDDSNYTMAKRPACIYDLKILFKALTGEELIESGFKLSI